MKTLALLGNEVKMRGNSKHTIKIERWKVKSSEIAVSIANDNDDHYWQGFESWDELRSFIDELKKAGNEAFGPPKRKRPRRLSRGQVVPV